MVSTYVPYNPLLRNVLTERKTATTSQTPSACGLHSGISDQAGALLGKVILEHSVANAVEVGLANGFSTLFIMDALDQAGSGTLTSLDPFQESDWQCRGLERVKKAAFSSVHNFVPRSAWQCLPELIEDERRFDLAFIDGSHSFDNAFVDFYLVDKLLGQGSILVFDDVGWSGVERVVHYVVANRDYEVLDGLTRESTSKKEYLKPIKKFGDLIGRTHRTPTREYRRLLERINKMSFVVLQKTSTTSCEKKFRYF